MRTCVHIFAVSVYFISISVVSQLIAVSHMMAISACWSRYTISHCAVNHMYYAHEFFVLFLLWLATGWFYPHIFRVSSLVWGQHANYLVSSINSPLCHWRILPKNRWHHCNDVQMREMASQITSLTIVYSTVCSGADQRKTSQLRVPGLCAGHSPATGEFPTRMARNAENNSIWWRHHVLKMQEWLNIALFLWMILFSLMYWMWRYLLILSTILKQVIKCSR